MKPSKNLIQIAKESIIQQSQAISKIADLITEDFEAAVTTIYNAKGRVIITGIGKSAIIANKIVATMNSTGTPAVFLHAADAIHGDLGSILEQDVVMCLSKSGNTPEIKVLVPLIKRGNNKLIAITGNTESFLAKSADFVLNTFVEKEACPNNLAPTTSTSAQLVMGDAVAIALLELRGFTSKDFAKFHPGGALGKRLYLKVSDISSRNMAPKVLPNTTLKDVIIEISKSMLGVTAVVENDEIIGIITDGDLRRMLSNSDDILSLTAKEIMSAGGKRIDLNAMAIDALDILERNEISQLLVENNGKYAGVIHIHDLIKEGIL